MTPWFSSFANVILLRASSMIGHSPTRLAELHHWGKLSKVLASSLGSAMTSIECNHCLYHCITAKAPAPLVQKLLEQGADPLYSATAQPLHTLYESFCYSESIFCYSESIIRGGFLLHSTIALGAWDHTRLLIEALKQRPEAQAAWEMLRKAPIIDAIVREALRNYPISLMGDAIDPMGALDLIDFLIDEGCSFSLRHPRSRFPITEQLLARVGDDKATIPNLFLKHFIKLSVQCSSEFDHQSNLKKMLLLAAAYRPLSTLRILVKAGDSHYVVDEKTGNTLAHQSAAYSAFNLNSSSDPFLFMERYSFFWNLGISPFSKNHQGQSIRELLEQGLLKSHLNAPHFVKEALSGFDESIALFEQKQLRSSITGDDLIRIGQSSTRNSLRI